MPKVPNPIDRAIDDDDLQNDMAKVVARALENFEAKAGELKKAHANDLITEEELDSIEVAMKAASAENARSEAYWANLAKVVEVATTVASKLL